MTNAIPMDVIIGVDTHKDVHAAAAISGAGVHLATTTIPASSKGYGALEASAKSMGAIQSVRHRGHRILWLPACRGSCASEDIPSSRSTGPIGSCGIKGKSDAVDAESAARAVLSGQAAGQL